MNGERFFQWTFSIDFREIELPLTMVFNQWIATLEKKSFIHYRKWMKKFYEWKRHRFPFIKITEKMLILLGYLYVLIISVAFICRISNISRFFFPRDPLNYHLLLENPQLVSWIRQEDKYGHELQVRPKEICVNTELININSFLKLSIFLES